MVSNNLKKKILQDNSKKVDVLPPGAIPAKNGGWFFPGKGTGRPKGSRSKFAETFLKDFLADWEENGPEAIAECRNEDPATYLRVAASILPKELNIKEGESILETLLEKFGDKQLDEFIAGVITLGAAQKSAGSEIKKITGAKPNCVY